MLSVMFTCLHCQPKLKDEFLPALVEVEVGESLAAVKRVKSTANPGSASNDISTTDSTPKESNARKSKRDSASSHLRNLICKSKGKYWSTPKWEISRSLIYYLCESREENSKRGGRPDPPLVFGQITSIRQYFSLDLSRKCYALAGVKGAGRTSLFNALKGSTDGSKSEIDWRDLPGYDPRDQYSRSYSYDLALFAYDAVLIVLGDKLCGVEREIALACSRFRVPYIFVRPRADLLLSSIDPRFSYQALINEILMEASEEVLSNLIDEVHQQFVKCKNDLTNKIDRELHKVSLSIGEMDVPTDSQKVFLVNTHALAQRSTVPMATPKTITFDEEAFLTTTKNLREGHPIYDPGED